MQPGRRTANGAIWIAVVAVAGMFPLTATLSWSQPSAANSTLPSMVTVGLTHAGTFDVIVRNNSNNPIAGSLVVVSLGSCGAKFCSTQPTGVTIHPGNQAWISTDASGRARISICGTLGAPCTATISADGVTLATVPAHNTVTPTKVQTSMTFSGSINSQAISYPATATLTVASGHFDAVATSIAASPAKKCKHHITTKH